MNTTKSTKRSLMMSIVSLLLCFSMLLGTTYAWFTDSATSSGNKIQAGTLDVELWLHGEGGSTDIGASGTPLFGVNSDSLAATEDSANTVWEPGKTQTVYLSIKNAGNLDLKYAVAIEVTKATGGLEKYMEYKITPDAKYNEGKIDWTAGKKVTKGTNTDATDVFLAAGKEHFFALSIHMDELATNDQMGESIEFDIKVLATQVASESDSLGSGYDAGATYPSVNTEKVPTNAPAEGTPISNDNVTVVVPKTAEAGNYALEVANKKVVTDNGNGEGEINLDITLKKDGVKVSGDTYTVRVKIAKEGTPLNIAKVTHNGEEIAESKYNYDKSTGYITFTTTHFSPFVITYYDSDLSVNLGADATPEQKAEAMGEKLANLIAKGGKFTLNENVIVDESIVIPEGVNVVLDLNGYSISGATGMTSPVVFNYGILDMKNGTVNATETTAIRNSGVNAKLNMSNMSVLQTVAVNPEWLGTAVFTANGATTTINSGNYVGISSAAIVATSGGHLIINGGNFASNDSTVRVDSWDYGSYMTINGGTFNVNVEGARALYADGYKNVEINSGIFNGTIDSTYTNININGGTFNKSIKQPGGHQNKYAIRGGNFVEDVTYYLVEGFNVVEANGTYHVVADGFKVIASAVDLVALGGQKLEGTYVLVADINMNGAAMPTIGAAYGKTLTIIGNGHTISNATTAHTAHNGMKHHGFFYAYTNSTLTISDLTFDNIVVDATKDAERNYGAAVVVAFADGDSTINLTNVDVKNSKVLNSTPDIGDEAGIYVGYQTGTLNMVDCDSINCVVAGETDAKTGAFIGMVNGTANVTNCTTDMTIGLCNRIGGTLTVDGAVYVIDAAGLEKAINAGTKAVILAEGDYALRFTNNTNFNLNDMTIKGLGDVNLAISSTEAWYGRVQGSNVTFENIHFTSAVGATGQATYNNCVFDSWTICASGNNERTYFNNCTINGCLNTSVDFSSGDTFVKDSTVAKAEFGGSATMNFENCTIGELISWDMATVLNNCTVTKLDDSHMVNNSIVVNP